MTNAEGRLVCPVPMCGNSVQEVRQWKNHRQTFEHGRIVLQFGNTFEELDDAYQKLVDTAEEADDRVSGSFVAAHCVTLTSYGVTGGRHHGGVLQRQDRLRGIRT
jgi:hypothetical protein